MHRFARPEPCFRSFCIALISNWAFIIATEGSIDSGRALAVFVVCAAVVIVAYPIIDILWRISGGTGWPIDDLYWKVKARWAKTRR